MILARMETMNPARPSPVFVLLNTTWSCESLTAPKQSKSLAPVGENSLHSPNLAPYPAWLERV